jgi:hypothetical protein
MMRWFSVDVMIFYHKLARWLRKIIAYYVIWCVGPIDAIFCNSLQDDSKDDSMLCHMIRWSDWGYLSVTSLQDDYRKDSIHYFGVTFRSNFQGCEYRISATNRWKVLRKESSNHRTFRSTVENLCLGLKLGAIKLSLHMKIAWWFCFSRRSSEQPC